MKHGITGRLRFVGGFMCRRRRKILVFLAIINLVGFIYGYTKYFKEPLYVFINSDIYSECVIPKIDPFDETIMKYFFSHPPPLTCDKTPSLLFVDGEGLLQFNESVSGKRNGLSCTYSIVDLVDDFNVEFRPEVTFRPPHYVDADVFIARCKTKDGKKIYENLHHKIETKKVLKSRTIKNESDEDLSVVLFGVDSLSRLAAFRKLPKTVAYLQNDMNAYTFKGYNKIGDHTFPNLVGLLTGRDQSGWPNVNLDEDYADKFPLIIQNFSRNNYVTMHAEDWPEIATFDQVMKRGFERPAGDHYMRPFFLAMRKILPMSYTIDQVFMFLESKSVKLRKTSSMCYGNRANHLLVIDYYKQFLSTYRGKRKFSFGWLNELGHNYVNFFELGDSDFTDFLKWMNKGTLLEKTILIFFSDHGSRVDEIRNTYIGRIEDRMPFLSIVVPEFFKRRYPHIHENLVANTQKLTSAYDLHEMLSDILHKRFKKEDQVPETNSLGPHSISLFREIPKKRSCADARIPEHYCACYSYTKLNVSDTNVVRIGNFVLEQIQSLLKDVMDKCAKLSIQEIVDVRLVKNNLERNEAVEKFTLQNWLFKPEEIREDKFLINIRTTPGNASFEATVKHKHNDDSLHVMSDISRTNRFGNTSSCMTVRLLKNYCLCI